MHMLLELNQHMLEQVEYVHIVRVEQQDSIASFHRDPPPFSPTFKRYHPPTSSSAWRRWMALHQFSTRALSVISFYSLAALSAMGGGGRSSSPEALLRRCSRTCSFRRVPNSESSLSSRVLTK